MKQIISILAALLLIGVIAPTVNTQGTTAAEAGDPPIAALISISPSDETGNVTISGAPGAVFPGAQVIIRNLYTEQLVYTQAGITGSFSATIYGPANTPFWISPSPNVPSELRNLPGSLPGGPGTIIYGSFPEARSRLEVPFTQIIVDGNLTDWQDYNQISIGGGYLALRNQDSLFIGAPVPSAEYSQMQIQIEVEGTRYNIKLDPRVYVTAVWEQLGVNARDLGTLPVAAESGDAIELRMPIAPLAERIFNLASSRLLLTEIAFLDLDGNVVQLREFTNIEFPIVEEQDGIVYPEQFLDGNDVIRFTVSGPVAQGASTWHARLRMNGLQFEPGDDLIMEMDVTMTSPALPDTLAGLEIIGRIGLQPVIGADGMATSAGLHVNNGWANIKTSSGLAIDGLESEIILGDIVIPPPQVIRRGDNLIFGIGGVLPIPADLPSGVYVPYFEGYARTGDGEPFRWSDNGLLGEGPGVSRVPLTRMPVALNIGFDNEQRLRLLWTLFHDETSDGSRGLMALEDQDVAGLSNRVQFNSPTFIIPPSQRYNGEEVAVSLEPYLVNMLPNAYDSSAAPLLPLLFPNGRLDATVQLPDGTVDNLSSAPVVQNMLSSVAVDERQRFGEQSQVDVYRLTTLNDLFSSYRLDTYGEHVVSLNGFVEDFWGNRYEGGGTYPFLVAEMLDVSPAVLPGTPLEVGNVFNPGVHVSPGVAATVKTTIRVFPLNSDIVIEETFEGTANHYGVFQPDEGFVFDAPGEYVVDYEVRYTDLSNRLWAGSLRGAGVIGSAESSLIAHGQRGMVNFQGETHPAWFVAERYSLLDSEEAQLYAPYQSGDAIWFNDGRAAGVYPRIRLQDVTGNYETWLLENHPDYAPEGGVAVDQLVTQDTLPAEIMGSDAASNARVALQPGKIANEGYAYISYVGSNVTLRQMVLGRETEHLNLIMNPDDPLNGQIGAGVSGLNAGDFVFLYGGAILRNRTANVRDAAIYGSFATVIQENDALGARVFPPYQGAAGGPDGGPLFTLNNEPIGMFFHPTGIRPGDVLELGNVLAVTGHVAPTLASNVSVQITPPSGQIMSFEGVANAVGYFNNPASNIEVNEIGIWKVKIVVSHRGVTSAGLVEPPYPDGGVLGAEDSEFFVYVVPRDRSRLIWNQEDQDTAIAPGFPFNFTFSQPTGWTDVSAYATIRFPQMIIQDGDATLQGSTLTYQYNPAALNQRYPFFEGNDGRLRGEASSDPVHLTFVMVGTNQNGEFDIVARPIVIRHDRLLTID